MMKRREPSEAAGHPTMVRWLKRMAIALGLLIILLLIASYLIDEPIRRRVEQQINQSLKGYTVRIPSLHFSLLSLSVTLKGLTIVQDAYPQPPIATFNRLQANVSWREIFSGNLVGDLELDKPKIHVNLLQLKEETREKEPEKKKAWQEAVKAIYPLEINSLEITGGEITYIDEDPERPLKVSSINLEASNIRNIRAPDKAYPSPFHAEAAIFGTGRAVVDGRADFLAEPYIALSGSVRFDNVPLDYFRPVLARYNASLKGGLLSAAGEGEFSPKLTRGHLKELVVRDMTLDYVHTAATEAAEKMRAEKTKEAAKEATGKPGLLLKVDRLQMNNCAVGFINRQAKPDYRVFISQLNLVVTNLSNQFREGVSNAELTGQFMGSGNTVVRAAFRPEKEGPDFDLNLKIADTNMPAMNDLFRAYGNFDVSAGKFSLFSELTVKNRQVTGYVKPFFRDMQVYDKRSDEEKGIFRKLYERLVEGVASLLENRPREEIATKAEIAGTLDQPKTSTWQVIVELVRNAFFRAILPGFEEEVVKVGKD